MNVPETLRRHGATAAAVLLCAFHFASFQPGSRPLVTDVRYFVYFAWRVADGAVPHLDYFENKTQLAAFAGALLHALGDRLGIDPLMAIRWGYLTVAALGGLAVFFIFRRLRRKSAVAGGLGLLAYCSFGLLGVLPAVGNIPKLLMAIGASVAALLLYRRRWFWSGVAGALAFMDWQIGGLVGLAALATAALHGSPRRRAVLSVVAGGVTGLLPFLLYYGWHEALANAVRQVVGSTLFRGSVTLAGPGVENRLERIAKVAGLACPAQSWLFYLGLTGMAVAAWWLWRNRRDETHRLLLPLAIYHYGVVGFTLIDFQYYGDFFLLLHSIAFFLAVTWIALLDLGERAVAVPRRWIVTLAALVLAFAFARPGLLRPRLELVTPVAHTGATLADQRGVADRFSARIGDGSVAFLQNSELLFLMRRSNALPLAYWNVAAWSYYRSDPHEDFTETSARMLRTANADAVVPPDALGYHGLLRNGYVVETLSSDSDRYSVTVAIRSTEASATP
jgi:hypothetical protein